MGLTEKLQRRLGEKYAKYRALVRKLNKKIRLLQRKLKLREDLSAPFISGNAVCERLREKLFCSYIYGRFNSKGYEELINWICGDLDTLCSFTEGATDLEDDEREPLPSATLNYWLDIRDHTHRLDSALCSIWPQNCSSHKSHRAKIRLDVPKDDESDHETPKFNFSFSLSDDVAPIRWRDVTVLSLPTLSPPRTLQTRTSAPSRTGKKVARFALPDIAIDPVQTSRTCASMIKIDNLCDRFRQPCSRECCLGFLASEEWHYHIHDVAYQSRRLTPLRESLCQNANNITTRQK
jgi:hypothetical protein